MGMVGHLTKWPAWRFELGRCQQVLMSHFEITTLAGFGLHDQPAGVHAAGAIIQYLGETQPPSLKLLTGLSTYSLADFIVLDAATRRNLELTETIRSGSVKNSLLGILDQTITPMGKRLIRQWVTKPLLDVSSIHNRLDQVELFYTDGMLRAQIRTELKKLADLERLTNRVVAGSAQPRNLVAIRSTLQQLPTLKQNLPKR